MIEFELLGKKYNAIDNCELSIYLNESCNADCCFCIAQMRYEDRAKAFKKSIIRSDAVYFEQLDKILSLIPQFIKSVTITGGEPCLNPRLPIVVAKMKEHGFTRICVTTNGSFLLRKEGNSNLLSVLIENGLTNLVLSRSSENEEINQKIMRFQYEACSNEDIREIIRISSSHGVNLRISGIFLKNGVNDLETLFSYVSHYSKMGCSDFRFRELMDNNESNMCNMEKIEFCAKERVLIHELIASALKDKRFFLKKKIEGKSFFNNYVFDIEGATLVLQEEDSEYVNDQRNNHNCIYGLVVHPNGDLSSSWADGDNVLLKYE